MVDYKGLLLNFGQSTLSLQVQPNWHSFVKVLKVMSARRIQERKGIFRSFDELATFLGP